MELLITYITSRTWVSKRLINYTALVSYRLLINDLQFGDINKINQLTTFNTEPSDIFSAFTVSRQLLLYHICIALFSHILVRSKALKVLGMIGDTGWIPSVYRRWLSMLRYWNKLIQMDDHRITKKVFIADYNSHTEKKTGHKI